MHAEDCRHYRTESGEDHESDEDYEALTTSDESDGAEEDFDDPVDIETEEDNADDPFDAEFFARERRGEF